MIDYPAVEMLFFYIASSYLVETKTNLKGTDKILPFVVNPVKSYKELHTFIRLAHSKTPSKIDLEFRFLFVPKNNCGYLEENQN